MATWYINDGDLPFLNEFPEMKEIDDAPLSFWKIINGNLPFRNFSPMHTVDDAPLAFWRIVDGDLPFRVQFPKMYKVSAGSKLYLGNKLIKKIFFGDIKIKSLYNGDTKIF